MAINAPVITNPLTIEKAQMMCDKALNLFLSSKVVRANSLQHTITADFKVSIKINNRMFSTAGRARPHQIELNGRLLGTASDEKQYNTISHELAHCVDFAIHGKFNGHKRQWRIIHKAMGGNAERCHDMDTSGLRRAQPLHLVKALKTGELIKVKTRTANKLIRNPSNYPYHKYIGPCSMLEGLTS